MSPLEATPTASAAVAPRHALRPAGAPNASRYAVALGPTAFRDLQAAFGSQCAAATAYNRFLAQRAQRAAGRLTDWPGGEDDYAA